MDSDDTRENLVRALKTMLKEKPLAKITIGEISAAAGVSRQTFYYHFDNIFEIYKWALRSKLKSTKRSKGTYPSLLVSLLDWCHSLEKNKPLTLAFFNSPYMMDILGFIKTENMAVAKEFLSYSVGADLPANNLDVSATFLVSAYLGIIYDWIQGGMETPIDDVYVSISTLMGAALKPDIVDRVIENWDLKN